MKIAGLEKEIDLLNKKQQNTKVFLYMVIHDLKHPIESMISQLGLLKD